MSLEYERSQQLQIRGEEETLTVTNKRDQEHQVGFGFVRRKIQSQAEHLSVIFPPGWFRCQGVRVLGCQCINVPVCQGSGYQCDRLSGCQVNWFHGV